jgi:PPK2 family polyphosphate:nucleotide phosphotransferase
MTYHGEYRVKPGSRVDLSEWDASDKGGFTGGKDEGREELERLNRELEELQELLYAEGKHKMLIVLQAMDTGGKDGTIRHVFDGVNPQGVRVASFKRPTPEELAHDYLWRVHKHTPGKGEIVIFNRSHYEDVLVVRVHSLVPEEVWSKRYEHIAAFERLLADEGTTILKFFLNIDLDEQKERLQARLDQPNKHWKFDPGDLKERKLWPQYVATYEEAISRTSTEWAPWYIVPANRKWYRNLVIGSAVVETLRSLDMRYPEPDFDPDDIVIE